MAQPKSQLGELYQSLKEGRVSRRHFIEKASASALGAAGAIFLANAAVISAAGGSKNGFAVYRAQDGTPSASPVGVADAGLDAGTEGQERGAGGALNMIQWQAATSAFIHTATGTKDFLIGSLVNEPLLVYLPSGEIYPWLAAEVPSVEGGSLAEDLSSATFTLKEGVLWSDGEPFTAKDVRFTWQWITETANASVNYETWANIKDIEVVDDLTAKVTYKVPSAAWFEAFTDYTSGVIIPSHVFKDDPKNRNMDFEQMPIGTGPFKIDEFKANDEVILSMNENYREPNKPFFSNVTIKGGGDAPAAARAVIETGEYQFAWNLQVEPDVLAKMQEGEGAKGKVTVAQGTSLERIHINFSDPNKEVDGQKSEINTPHPYLSDPAVRNAMKTAIDRETIASKFYGPGQPATGNIINGIPTLESSGTSWEYNVEAAAKMLEDAGWKMNGDVREKDGVKLNLVYATSVNAVRQKTQSVVKQAFDSIGIKTQLEQVEASIYFDGTEGNEQNINHFYWDIDMYTNNPTSPVPISFLQGWYAGPDNQNVAQKSNKWQGQNFSRWINADFDAAFDELKQTTDMEKAAELCITMNDLVCNDVAAIPLVNRSADTYAANNHLRAENIVLGPLNSSDYWNIANWNFADGITSWDDEI